MRTRSGPRGAGFTLLELMMAGSVMAVGLLSLAGVMVPMSHQREQATARREVLESMQSMMEQVKGIAPDAVASTYDGDSLSLAGITGTMGGGNVITLDVDSTNPKLLRVTATASWTVSGKTHNLTIMRRIYNPNG